MALKKKNKNKITTTASIENTETKQRKTFHREIPVTEIPTPSLEQIENMLRHKQQNGQIFFPETNITLSGEISQKEYGSGYTVMCSITLTVPQCTEGVLLGYNTARQILHKELAESKLMVRSLTDENTDNG